MEYVWVAVVDSSTVPRIAWISGVTRISRITNVAKVTEILIDDHVFVQFSDIRSREFVYVSASELPDRPARKLMYVLAVDKSDGTSVGIVDIICHRLPLIY